MKNILAFATLSVLFLFTSCNSDDEPVNEPTVEEIQQDIHNTFEGFKTCMQGYENGSFSSSFKTFFNLSNGEMDSAYGKLLTDELGEFEFDLENFNMDNHAGVYNWDTNSESWNYTANNEGKLVFNFPFTDNGNSNNTKITIDDYTIQQFNFINGTEFYPTKILGSIERDGNEIFNIDLDNVTYHSDNEIASPVAFNLEIRTEPMTHSFTLTHDANNELTFMYNSHNDNSCSTTISLDASTVINDYAFMEDIEDFDVVSGVIGHDILEIRFNVQADNLTNIDEPTAAQINQLVEAKVYLSNNEVGELEYNEDNANDAVIYIVYNDGTREDATNYVNQDLADELEAIFTNYLN